MPEKRKEEASFTVTDRRLFTADGELRSETPERPEPQAAQETPRVAAKPESKAEPQTPATPETGDAADREMPLPPTSAEQEAQAAAYRQSAQDLDKEVELSGHSAKDFEITFERFMASLYMTAMLQLGLMRQQG